MDAVVRIADYAPTVGKGQCAKCIRCEDGGWWLRTCLVWILWKLMMSFIDVSLIMWIYFAATKLNTLTSKVNFAIYLQNGAVRIEVSSAAVCIAPSHTGRTKFGGDDGCLYCTISWCVGVIQLA